MKPCPDTNPNDPTGDEYRAKVMTAIAAGLVLAVVGGFVWRIIEIIWKV